jgi:hypothetical protein
MITRRSLLRWLFNHELKRETPCAAAASASREKTAGVDQSLLALKAGVLRLAGICESEPQDQLSSSVIGEATKIQEHLENLLRSCRDQRAEGHSAELLTAGALSLG